MVLWGLQIVLAMAMLVSGLSKSFMPKELMLQTGQTGVADLKLSTIRFIGLSELVGTIGIILPWWSGVLPWLTPLAALGFAVIMLLAFNVHTGLMHRAITPEKTRREAGNRITNLLLLATALVVALFRSYELVS